MREKTAKNRAAYSNFTCTARQKKEERQIGRSAFSLTPCIHLPFLPLGQPTQYTYARASRRLMHLTHLIPLFCPLPCSKSFCNELGTVEGIFLSFFKVRNFKKNPEPFCVTARSFAHLVIKQTLQVYSSFSQPFQTAFK